MLYKILNIIIASIWLINGLFCKVLNLVPRHQEIVAHIIETKHEMLITILIGCAEIVMALWILSGYKSRLNALAQMIIIGTMNFLEFMLVPELLLWGKMNALFALILIVVIYVNEFYFNKKMVN